MTEENSRDLLDLEQRSLELKEAQLQRTKDLQGRGTVSQATLEAAKAILAKEERALASLAEGGSLAEVYGVPEITVVKP